MTDLEIIMSCFLIPLSCVLMYIAGKYDILHLMSKMLEEAVDTYKGENSYMSNNDTMECIWFDSCIDDDTTRIMSDIDIHYNKKMNEYYLGIETLYYFKGGRKEQIEYYNTLLDKFTKFMHENKYETELSDPKVLIDPMFELKADSITELYVKFKIFVEGFKAVYGNE